jgi:2-phospho-L-lactate guanylyltransferase
MDFRTIIPVKSFGEAKQRLALVLNPTQRAHLAEEMFRHVLGVASNAFGMSNVLVISRSRDVLAIAEADGAMAVPESEPSELNSALAKAASIARAQGASHVLALASDLPLLEKSDLAELTKHDCAIAADRHRRGTNALLWPVALPFSFGDDSFARHRAIAGSAGLDPQIVARKGFAHDIDVPEDLIGAFPRPRFSEGEG